METEKEHIPNQAHIRVSYYRSLIIGLIHGLAGSAAMVLLTMSTVNSVWQGALYISIWSWNHHRNADIHNYYRHPICIKYETNHNKQGPYNYYWCN